MNDKDREEFKTAWARHKHINYSTGELAFEHGWQAARASQPDAEVMRIALERMDRARRILTNGNPTPDCNWGMLDTSDLRAAIAKGEKT